MTSRFRQWEVWLLDQPNSKLNSMPPQPLDPSGKHRPYLVICPQAHIDSNGDPVLMPLGSKSSSSWAHVQLKKGDGGVEKDCFVWCNQIVTVNERYLVNSKKIQIPEERRLHVQAALRDFFDL